MNSIKNETGRNICVHSDFECGLIVVHSKAPLAACRVYDTDGRALETPVLRRGVAADGSALTALDATRLTPWTPETPTLYTLKADGERIRFGHVGLTVRGLRILVNGRPFYFRGYIRGIEAHDHPNLTGGLRRDYFEKNIRQAKKYGFNLVRFHSTIPDPEFVELADELGMFIHMEIGYSYEFDEGGHKKRILIDEERWRTAITRFRTHPSVAIFCLGNEMHNAGRNPETLRMYRIGRSLAPGKLIVDNAGWGEFDRESSDVFIQHVAYYFPYGRHAGMFEEDFCWALNGSIHSFPISTLRDGPLAVVETRRRLNPSRPVIAHECVHYIDIPDYTELNRQFDEFAVKAGATYLADNRIEKPRHLLDLPKLIAVKGLEGRMPDYIAASRQMKRLAIKTYIERLRQSQKFEGFEMLQLADCFKYENKNGIIDCFDNDKYIDPEWMRSFNSDVVILTDIPQDSFHAGDFFALPIRLSNFSSRPWAGCSMKLFLRSEGREPELIFDGNGFSPGEGLSDILDVSVKLAAEASGAVELTAELTADDGRSFRNQWTLHVYPKPVLRLRPAMKLHDRALEAVLLAAASGLEPDEKVFLTDVLDDEISARLKEGRHVILNYHRDRPGNTYYLPGALDRFKPCIWDRGNNLGGVVAAEWLREAMMSGRYFDKNYHHLVEAAYKINLDLCPFRVDELVWGVDKPVRDRMKALIDGVKDFLPADTLRNFSYLFSLKAGDGILTVCTFNFGMAGSDPASAACLYALINQAPLARPAHYASVEAFVEWMRQSTQRGEIKEDVMNHFWEIDNKPVEDALFWEQAKIDLRKMSSREPSNVKIKEGESR